MADLVIRRLGPSDQENAGALFAVMARAFEEDVPQPDPAHHAQLLAREDFWAVGAWRGSDPVGGLTAHVLPLTRAAGSELMIYDIAILAEHRRCGIGRALMDFVRRSAREQGLMNVFVFADGDDDDARNFYRALDGEELECAMYTYQG